MGRIGRAVVGLPGWRIACRGDVTGQFCRSVGPEGADASDRVLWCLCVMAVAMLVVGCSMDLEGERTLDRDFLLGVLEGDRTMEDVREKPVLPTFEMASPVVTEKRRLLRDSPGHYDLYYLSGKRGGVQGLEADRRLLSVGRLADYEAELLVLADRVDLAGTLADYYEPAWYAERYIGAPGPHRTLGHQLRQAIDDYALADQLGDLLTAYSSYDDVYCLRQAGVPAVASHDFGLQIVDELPVEDMNYVSKAADEHHNGNVVKAKSAETAAGLSECESASLRRIWPLPYDPSEAWEWYRRDLHRFIMQWLEENVDLVPPELVVQP